MPRWPHTAPGLFICNMEEIIPTPYMGLSGGSGNIGKGIESMLLMKDQPTLLWDGGQGRCLCCSSAPRTEVPLTFCMTWPDLLSPWGLALHPCFPATLISEVGGRLRLPLPLGRRRRWVDQNCLCGLELVHLGTPVRLYRTGLQPPCKAPVGPSKPLCWGIHSHGALSQLIGGPRALWLRPRVGLVRVLSRPSIDH